MDNNVCIGRSEQSKNESISGYIYVHLEATLTCNNSIPVNRYWSAAVHPSSPERKRHKNEKVNMSSNDLVMSRQQRKKSPHI